MVSDNGAQRADKGAFATVPEVAAYLRVAKGTLYTWKYKDRGPKWQKVGRGLRYDWPDVEAWLKSQQQADLVDSG